MPTIYHYCDATAFTSVIQKRVLWLSNTRRMNDASEVVGMERAFRELIEVEARSANWTDQKLRSLLDDLAVNRPELYVACFSAQGDATVQWKTYAAAGRGFSLGFDSDLLWTNVSKPVDLGSDQPVWLPKWATPPARTMVLTPVLYLTPDIQQRIDEFLRGILSLPDIKRDPYVSNFLHGCAAVCKDSSFIHEEEWRLAYLPVIANGQVIIGELQDMLWRSGPHGITPYFAFDFQPTALREVILGPINPDHEPSSMHLVRHFLDAHGLSHVTIAVSKSPYRG
ncbi:DUF2971 domain-containing protein [Ralstonia flaminis]|uniref:DUF2971 domain-containing protein n=1 Tax=Ralstonia flaminis TaxID=3058597 RepID=A0ABN9JIU6_9RALS|nr:DUF2971 domain-containing protein [Ralstonia sp. LMG 18101]CAJ0810699.1 hypothetical protein LMG18101_00966 [Ralstonia sp. LMG 18101]